MNIAFSLLIFRKKMHIISNILLHCFLGKVTFRCTLAYNIRTYIRRLLVAVLDDFADNSRYTLYKHGIFNFSFLKHLVTIAAARD